MDSFVHRNDTHAASEYDGSPWRVAGASAPPDDKTVTEKSAAVSPGGKWDRKSVTSGWAVDIPLLGVSASTDGDGSVSTVSIADAARDVVWDV